MGKVSWTPAQLKKAWLKFFEERGHKIIPTLSIIPPEDDKSTLFINSGLCAIKKDFANKSKKSTKKKLFTSVQRVVRTVDINNIDKDAWHGTYFEMMGNFSIGGYFKREAIEYAIEFLSSVAKLDLTKLVITVHEKDDETESIWRELLGKEVEIIRMGSPNFWEIGDGPCGPCTEIYYDRGEKYDPLKLETTLIKKEIGNERYIEIWNIVFSQFWKSGVNYKELATKNIDTGAGLERMLTIMEGAENVYSSSQFAPIIASLEKFIDIKYIARASEIKDPTSELINSNFQVAADHIRTLAVLLGEGIVPSNKGRGYIARKLTRRLIVALIILGVQEIRASMYDLLEATLAQLHPLNPDLFDNLEDIKEKVTEEFSAFSKVLDGLEDKVSELIASGTHNIEEKVFTLVEREGVPIAILKKILRDRTVSFSDEKFQQFFNKHRESSKNKKFTSPFNLKH